MYFLITNGFVYLSAFIYSLLCATKWSTYLRYRKICQEAHLSSKNREKKRKRERERFVIDKSRRIKFIPTNLWNFVQNSSRANRNTGVRQVFAGITRNSISSARQSVVPLADVIKSARALHVDWKTSRIAKWCFIWAEEETPQPQSTTRPYPTRRRISVGGWTILKSQYWNATRIIDHPDRCLTASIRTIRRTAAALRRMCRGRSRRAESPGRKSNSARSRGTISIPISLRKTPRNW